jgi:hypothetical protein
MSYATHCGPLVRPLGHAPARPKKPGWLRQLLARLMAVRQRRADREIARYLAQNGCRLTDAAEREIMQRLFVNDWGMRR